MSGRTLIVVLHAGASEMAAGPGLPAWDVPPLAVPARGARAWRWLLLATIFFGALTFIAMWTDSRAWEAVKRDSVRTPAVVRTIHPEDDFVTPSRVDVDLSSEPTRSLTVRTSDEERYRVGQHVEVWYDARHPDRAGFVGDSTGPTWALGAMSIGIVGTALSGVPVMPLGIGASFRAVRRRWRSALGPDQITVVRGLVVEALAAREPASPEMGIPELRGTRIARRAQEHRVSALWTATVGAGLALLALIVHVASGTGRIGVDTFLAHLAIPLFAAAVFEWFRAAHTGRKAPTLTWTAVGVMRLRSTRFGTPRVLLAEDPDHAVVVRGFRGEAISNNGPFFDDGPGWVSLVGSTLLLYQDSYGLPRRCHAIDGWQHDARLRRPRRGRTNSPDQVEPVHMTR